MARFFIFGVGNVILRFKPREFLRDMGYSEEEAEAIRRTMSCFYCMFAPVEGTADLLHELERAGHGLYYLSNFHERASKFVVAKNPVFSLFAGGLFSWQVKRLKPAPEIYRALLDRYGLDPRDCVFVDDVAENVAAATALGMDGVLFTTPGVLREYLTSNGGEVCACNGRA